MARLLGPDPATRLAVRYSSARVMEGLPGRTLTVYTDEACTIPASIAAYDPDDPGVPGSVISGSKVKVAQDSRIPLFWFPSGVDVVWAQTSDQQVTFRLIADMDARLDRQELRLNAKSFGAVGDGDTDDTAAVQAAIEAVPDDGGAVYFPAGQYRLTDTLALRSNLLLIGDGDGASLLQQVTANKDLMSGTGLNKITLEGLYLVGTGAGTGSGVVLTKGGNDATPYIRMVDVTTDSFGRDGVSIENAIVCHFERVLCQDNGRYGFNFFGQTGGAAGTSCTFTACYGNANGTAGFRLFNMVYMALAGCATDHNPIGYLIDTCQGVSVVGSGAEGNATAGVRITGGYGNTLVGFWVYDNRGVGVHITGNAQTASVIAATDNSPNASATNFIKVDAGSRAALMNCNNTTANSLATGTTNVVADAAGGAQFQGYTALLDGGEFDGDLACYDANKGIVLTDRVSSSQYRLLVSGGTLSVEAV